MSSSPQTQPIEEEAVPKVNDEVAVGENLSFQRKWWVFERVIWGLFSFILVLDIAGVLGRGPAAKAEAATRDSAMHLKYERIERYGTPSLLVVQFTPLAIHEGKIQLWVSNSLVKELGNQRIVPQPIESKLQDDGFLYTFLSAAKSAPIQFALEPQQVGLHRLTLGLANGDRLALKIFVMP
jgi:hypothetical protein